MNSIRTHRTLGRRDFLAAGLFGAGCARAQGLAPQRAVILFWMGGGLSHLDTFDMKPLAPRAIRGEFRAISTSVPGIAICEHLAQTARHVNRLTIIRSMTSGENHHERAMSRLDGGPLDVCCEGTAGVRVSTGLDAVRAIEKGARCATVAGGWLDYDTHENNFATLKNKLLPRFDRDFAVTIERLEEAGLLPSTLVVVTGEFGRSPRINARGGRDHHARAWSAALAGAGVPGGCVYGSTDRFGAEVREHPVTPEDLLATVNAILGRKDAPDRGGRVIQQLVKA